MSDIAALVAGNLDIWTSATQRKSGAGRGGGGKRISLYGIERLRALILDLAVRGKLVPQDAGDEPASELLRRIDKFRAAKVPKLKSAPQRANADTDQSAPLGWEVVRLDRLANSQAGFAFKSKGFNEVGAGLPLIRIRDVGQPFTGTFYSGDYRDEFVVVRGDYLISMDGEFRIATWPGPDALLNQRVSRLQFYGEQTSQAFVAIALQLEIAKLQGVKAYTTVDHLSGKQISETAIPLPPLAEQRRIVAKVDALMALCDALERESADAMAAHQALVEELLGLLVNSADATDLAANWARLETHFDTLFSTDTSIGALKQTILDLAVRGKLVAQEKGGKSNSLPLRKLIGPMDSGWSPACSPFPAQAEDAWGILKTTAVQFLRYVQEENKELPAKLTPRPEAECRAGDILVTRAGPTNRVGIVCFVPETRCRLMISDKIIRFRPASSDIDGEYLALALSVGPAAAQIDAAKSGMAASQVNISQAKLREVTVTIPPLAEQHRIVAKVDALMALCDQLKTRLADAAQTQRHLADAITERAAV
jgi:type I restriction enzyme S subunit